MNEFVSVVIPTYNRKETLEVVLPSLFRQNHPKEAFEIIVVDSGSTDGTIEFLKSFQDRNLRFFSQENRGRSGARNKGIREAKGDLVLFTDADIIAHENLISEHIKYYREHPDSAVIGCEVQVNSLEEYARVKDNRKQFRTLHPENRKKLSWLYFLTGNALVSRQKLIQVGMFDEGFTGYGHEDLELGYRLEASGVKIRYNPNAINYHWHPVEFSEQCKKMKLAGTSTVRFYNKYRDPIIKIKLGMTPLSLGIHSLIKFDGWLMNLCEDKREKFRLCREILLQYHYINGIKEALKSSTGVITNSQ